MANPCLQRLYDALNTNNIDDAARKLGVPQSVLADFASGKDYTVQMHAALIERGISPIWVNAGLGPKSVKTPFFMRHNSYEKPTISQDFAAAMSELAKIDRHFACLPPHANPAAAPEQSGPLPPQTVPELLWQIYKKTPEIQQLIKDLLANPEFKQALTKNIIKGLQEAGK